MKQNIISYLDTIKNEILSLSKYLYDNPEESFHEYKACNYLTNILRSNNFEVKDNYLNIPTAFYAQFGTGHPKVCYICEYDAVKKLGHIVGHNLISAMSIGAALAVSKVIPKIHGSVIVLGCPGEFVGSAKITMAKQGTFDDIDAVLMAHPDTVTAASGTSMAVLPLKITYKSKSGLSYRNQSDYNALDACLFSFNSINLLAKGFGENSSIDSVIINGGDSPYLMPDKSESKFYIRAPKMTKCCEIEKKIRKLVQTTSELMDIKYDVCMHELPYDEFVPNKTLSRIFSHNLKESGIIAIGGPKNTNSSLSLGTVSSIVPCIHPYISICDGKSIKYSSEEFASATISYCAQERILRAAQALALTGLDLIENSSLLAEVKNDFCSSHKCENSYVHL